MGTRIQTRADIANSSFVDFGTERLQTLCKSLGLAENTRELVTTFAQLMSPWGEQRIGVQRRYESNIADDGAPFELAIAISPRDLELQVYVEPQGEPPTLCSNMAAGITMLRRCTAELEAVSERLRRIEDLFFPELPRPPFTTWIGASWRRQRGIRLKAYLNPQVLGASRALDVVAEAMDRLGFGAGWATVRDRLSDGAQRDEAAILSLDLDAGADARVKIYVRHGSATVTDIEAMARLSPNHHRDDAPEFYEALAGQRGPFVRKPPIVEYTFVEAESARPEQITFEFPIGSYVPTDEVARQRIVRCLSRFGLPTAAYERAVAALALRPLDAGTGMHAHVTFRRDERGPRIGVYWATEAYRRT